MTVKLECGKCKMHHRLSSVEEMEFFKCNCETVKEEKKETGEMTEEELIALHRQIETFYTPRIP